MRKLTPDKIEADMVLAKPIEDSDGKVLLGTGATISTRLISRIAEMDIPFIYVEGDPESSQEEDKPPVGYLSTDMSLEEILKDLDWKFKKAQNDPVMREIKSCIAQRLKAALSENSNE